MTSSTISKGVPKTRVAEVLFELVDMLAEEVEHEKAKMDS
tara:strand:- start:3875 stop:3994 length:120 start_codon:yes stop_codon:yes gene_type:complete